MFTALIAHTVGDYITIGAGKLVDWIGCDSTSTTPQDIRDAWDSAIDIVYVSSGKIEWGYHPSIDFLVGPTRDVDDQDTIKGKVMTKWT